MRFKFYIETHFFILQITPQLLSAICLQKSKESMIVTVMENPEFYFFSNVSDHILLQIEV